MGGNVESRDSERKEKSWMDQDGGTTTSTGNRGSYPMWCRGGLIWYIDLSL